MSETRQPSLDSRGGVDCSNAEGVSSEVIRVCHVSMSLKTGGLERLLVDFSRFHNHERFAMQFVGLSGDGQPAEDIRSAGCFVRVLNESVKIRKLRTIAELANVLRAGRIQVVHTHNTYAHFYGALAAKLAGVPVIVNTQHGRGCGKGWKAKWQFRIANRLTRQVVGVSRDAALLCQSDDPHSREKIIAIWNGINLDRFTYVGPKLVPTAISVARLSKEKDFPTLLEAVRHVLPHVPDFRLQIVGDGPERTTIEKKISELNLGNHIELLGERHDVAQLLTQAGFFVSATRTEGVSLTLLEAMAVGLPIVTTSVGGNPEVVLDGRTGRLVPDGDPLALARAMIDMCGDRGSWTLMGLLGRQRVEENFEIRNMIGCYETLYEELLLCTR
jgi:glycosyltransferase involved in cell wall biosynthesis